MPTTTTESRELSYKVQSATQLSNESIAALLHNRGIPAFVNLFNRIIVTSGKLHWGMDGPGNRDYLWCEDENKYPDCCCEGCCERLGLTQVQRYSQVLHQIHGLNADIRREASEALAEDNRRNREIDLRRLQTLQQLYLQGAVTRSDLIAQVNRMTPGLIAETNFTDEIISIGVNGPSGRRDYYTYRPRQIQQAAITSNSITPPYDWANTRSWSFPYSPSSFPYPPSALAHAQQQQQQPEIKVEEVNKQRQIRLED